ncbi:hypothetical protein Tco_1408656 [Tanacetum coccineum]
MIAKVEKLATKPMVHAQMIATRVPDQKIQADRRAFQAFRFYVIEPNKSVSVNLIVIESRDVIFDENRFSSVLKPSQMSLINGTEDIGDSMVPEKVSEEVVVQQPEPELKNRTPKNFGSEFQLYLIEGTSDEVSDQHSYCFNVKDEPKTFDEAWKSYDVAF